MVTIFFMGVAPRYLTLSWLIYYRSYFSRVDALEEVIQFLVGVWQAICELHGVALEDKIVFEAEDLVAL